MKEDLKDWVCSFSGCDGGNIDADIWLCGIEWGYKDATDEQRQYYYKTRLLEEIKNGKVELNSNYDMFSDLTPQFNLKAKKLYAAITGNEQGKLLKLNLSPIAFRKDDSNLWNNNIIKATGYETKENFIQDLINSQRFKGIRDKYKPKVIIGIGVTHKNNFAKSFFGKTINFTHGNIVAQSEKNQRTRNFYHTKYDGTLLVVIPFLGFRITELNSDYLLQKTGRKIKDLLNAV